MNTKEAIVKQKLTAENIREQVGHWGDGEFRRFRKTTTTEMAYVTVPEGCVLDVDTKEGEYHLAGPWEGTIALDADGDPYPIEWDIVRRTYAEVHDGDS